MPVYVLFIIPKLGASPPDVNTPRNSFEVSSLSDWKEHSIFFGKEGRKKRNDHLMERSIFYINLKVRDIYESRCCQRPLSAVILVSGRWGGRNLF